MQNVTLSLTVEEISALVSIVGNLPTSSNIHQLYTKIVEQAREQLKEVNSDNKNKD